MQGQGQQLFPDREENMRTITYLSFFLCFSEDSYSVPIFQKTRQSSLAGGKLISLRQYYFIVKSMT